MYINVGTGVGKEEKTLPYTYNKLFHGGDGVGTYDDKGLSGRFSDFTYAKDQAVSYEKDTVEGTFTEVRQIRIADFIKKVVATRRFQSGHKNSDEYPPSVVMKLDVEGRELDVVPDLVMSGALQHLDCLYIDWTRDRWTDASLVRKLSDAMNILSTTAKDRGLLHTTEVHDSDDESYYAYNGPLPQCRTPSR